MVLASSDKIMPALGFRNALGVALPIAAGVAAGALQPGLAVSTGALNVSFSDSAEPYIVRGWRMLAASVLVGMAVAPAAITGIAAGILANSHRLAHAIMALGAGLASSHPLPARSPNAMRW